MSAVLPHPEIKPQRPHWLVRTSELQKRRPCNCRVRSEGALPPRASRDTANFDLGVLRRATLRIEVCAGDGFENQDQHDKDRARWQSVADQRHAPIRRVRLRLAPGSGDPLQGGRHPGEVRAILNRWPRRTPARYAPRDGAAYGVGARRSRSNDGYRRSGRKVVARILESRSRQRHRRDARSFDSRARPDERAGGGGASLRRVRPAREHQVRP